MHLAERSRARDFEATVVAELVGVHAHDEGIGYELQITNAGPAVARDVDVSLIKWDDSGPLGITLAHSEVAPALLRGERRTVSLTLQDRSLANDRAISIELNADYYDDNGVRNERLAFVVDDSLVLTPPPPRSDPAIT